MSKLVLDTFYDGRSGGRVGGWAGGRVAGGELIIVLAQI